MRTRVHPRGLVEEQRGQQEECHFEAGKREGHQHEPEETNRRATTQETHMPTSFADRLRWRGPGVAWAPTQQPG
jgi:hypothetical protein